MHHLISWNFYWRVHSWATNNQIYIHQISYFLKRRLQSWLIFNDQSIVPVHSGFKSYDFLFCKRNTIFPFHIIWTVHINYQLLNYIPCMCVLWEKNSLHMAVCVGKYLQRTYWIAFQLRGDNFGWEECLSWCVMSCLVVVCIRSRHDNVAIAVMLDRRRRRSHHARKSVWKCLHRWFHLSVVKLFLMITEVVFFLTERKKKEKHSTLINDKWGKIRKPKWQLNLNSLISWYTVIQYRPACILPWGLFKWVIQSFRPLSGKFCW